MAKYLVILKVVIAEDNEPDTERTLEYNINCDPDKLSKEVASRKARLQEKGDAIVNNTNAICNVTVVQVLPL